MAATTEVRAVVGGKRIHAGAHRVVWTYFNGPIPDGAEINHRNGIRDDNRPENLEPLTPSENVSHSFRELGKARTTGETNGQATLTAEIVLAIREARLIEGASLRDVAARFGVSEQQVSRLALGDRWADGPWPAPADLRVREFPGGAA